MNFLDSRGVIYLIHKLKDFIRRNATQISKEVIDTYLKENHYTTVDDFEPITIDVINEYFKK